MTDPSDSSESNTYSLIVLTFRRPDELALLLTSVRGQTQQPSLLVVVDNDPDRSAEPVVEQLMWDFDCVVHYLSTGVNLGPAGGWAAGAAHAAQHSDRGRWVSILDDDDPVDSPEIFALLATQAAKVAAEKPRVATVGLRGATLNSCRMRLTMARPSEGAVRQVDYLASGGAPLYSWAAIDEIGFFDEDLFFGFEDLELAMRLRHGGWTLYALGAERHVDVSDTSSTRSPWREYYKTRALTTVARRYFGFWQLAVLFVRSVALGSLKIMATTRSLAIPEARLAGFIHGVRGQLGSGNRAPTSNPAKPAPPA